MATAHIEMPYDRESGRTPWAPAQRIQAAARKRGYRPERIVSLSSGRGILRLSADMKKPPT